MHYELDLTTSPLRGTPPKNSSVIFKRRVIALIGAIVPSKQGSGRELRHARGELCIMNYAL